MDNSPEGITLQDLSTLSYDDSVAYEAQVPTEAERAAAAVSLANRISSSKVYLLSESSSTATRSVVGKRKHDEEEVKMDEDEEMNEDLSYRPNALLLNGSPIAHLPTTRIFAYATHFDAHPLGLEWVDDNTCVLVFESRRAALEAFTRLQKAASEESDMDGRITARPFPIALWPPEERIKQTVGQGQGLKGAIRMRWAKPDDVKKKGAMKESKFYQKHGSSAGKELFNGRDLPPAKRRRQENGGYENEEMIKAQLDNELDQFLAEDDVDEIKQEAGSPAEGDAEPDIPASPPSKMRSDYIAKDGRTLLERTSHLRVHTIGDDGSPNSPDLASRLTAPLPRRSRQRRGEGGRNRHSPPIDGSTGLESLSDRLQAPSTVKLEWGPADPDSLRRRRNGRSRDADVDGGGDADGDNRRRRWEEDRERPVRPTRGTRTGERPKKTQQELDDELDAFLRGS